MIKNNKWLPAVILICLGSLLIGCNNSQKSDVLSSWSEDSATKKEIVNFVEAVTDKDSSDFVPVQDRIATFDMDGTILCEKQYWIELAVAIYHIQNDLQDNKELNEKLNTLLTDLNTVPEPAETGILIEQVTGEAFAGVSEEEFVNYVSNFMELPKEDFEDLTYGDSFYKPMLELIQYLRDNDFHVYLVSGSERGVVWGSAEGVIDLERGNMIGSDMQLIPSNYDSSNLEYIFQPDDELVRGSTFSHTDVKLDKVYNIYHQIGKKPIFACGNTDGDFSMLNFARSNSYRNLSVLICHDDNEREYDYHVEERPVWNKYAEQYGWKIVSMKNEFEAIFLKDGKKVNITP
ncbi:haloacid dehalogenase-like hydrolase [Anaeromicropila populeti]|uniref:Haloacid dehalogenase-like hydrolase n=1 Tax=Anaeromicropila populeti TaxID=37658 RepID=A0A1I6KGS5_9FIRM|nr:HAD family hydrolase [Anaeromicropila populeti]SFR90441.1 haloacid dehalogenase-like hydrolase [Anaeromicropila populeti]